MVGRFPLVRYRICSERPAPRPVCTSKNLVKRRLVQLILVSLALSSVGVTGKSEPNYDGGSSAPDGGPPTVTIAAYSSSPAQLARFWSTTVEAPLVVDLHQWSADQSGFNG